MLENLLWSTKLPPTLWPAVGVNSRVIKVGDANEARVGVLEELHSVQDIVSMEGDIITFAARAQCSLCSLLHVLAR